ncbi:MAG: hypothetical protein CME26_15580 [Gemmatimonadetes bacterium]|nr:hypothetical protein [Gemmatimonadota bacterium]
MRRFQDMAVGYAFSLLRDLQTAQDVAPEAFLGAHRSLRPLDHPEAFASWPRCIVFTHANRVLRRKSIVSVDIDVAPEVFALAPTPDQRLEEEHLRTSVHRVIGALPEEERNVVTLFYFGEHTMREIGGFLEVPLSTVQNRLRSGRKKLKEGILEMAKTTLTGMHRLGTPNSQTRSTSAMRPRPETRVGYSSCSRSSRDWWM